MTDFQSGSSVIASTDPMMSSTGAGGIMSSAGEPGNSASADPNSNTGPGASIAVNTVVQETVFTSSGQVIKSGGDGRTTTLPPPGSFNTNNAFGASASKSSSSSGSADDGETRVVFNQQNLPTMNQPVIDLGRSTNEHFFMMTVVDPLRKHLVLTHGGAVEFATEEDEEHVRTMLRTINEFPPEKTEALHVWVVNQDDVEILLKFDALQRIYPAAQEVASRLQEALNDPPGRERSETIARLEKERVEGHYTPFIPKHLVAAAEWVMYEEKSKQRASEEIKTAIQTNQTNKVKVAVAEARRVRLSEDDDNLLQALRLLKSREN